MNATTRPIRTLLIANRGEIAVRIARTCRDMGIRTVAVYSQPDRDAVHAITADYSLPIGPAAVRASYLNVDAILQAAKMSGADAIHPGYGFMSENAGFARAVEAAGLIWVGPHPEAIEQMGSKAGAKAIMERHSVPVVPGYSGEDQQDDRLYAEAGRIGFPLLVKASAGGGGKGMVIVRDAGGIADAIARARREAQAAFGDARLILERYFDRARHVEFQIFGDRHGNAVHLFERECSLQRRYQKIMEESPSPVLGSALRKRMGEAAVAAAKALNYDNAGTVEFILMPDGNFYFLEVNTRLQVEHPVTEMTTGLDLVRLQIEVAEGRPLPWKQEDLQQSGYALELRLYAEDPATGFLPASGPVLKWQLPVLEGFRCDSAVQSGSFIGTDYDPMIAKLIARGENRAEAFRRMEYALENMVCLGLSTNQAFLKRLVGNADVREGNYHTHFLDENPQLAAGIPLPPDRQHALALALSAREFFLGNSNRSILRKIPAGWRNVRGPESTHRWIIGGALLTVHYRGNSHGIRATVTESGTGAALPEMVNWLFGDENQARIEIKGMASSWHFTEDEGSGIWVHDSVCGPVFATRVPRFPEAEAETGTGGYAAPMPAEVSAVHVREGQQVEAGQALIVLYSMKMEHTISAENEGRVLELFVQPGDRVEAGMALLTLGSADAEAERK